MTINTENRVSGPYTGNGVATSFVFDFKVFERGDVVVVHNVSGIEFTLVLDSDYSVTLNPDQDNNPGGSVTYPLSGSPMPSPETLTVTSDVPDTQGADLQNLGGFYPQVIENALDRLTIVSQQLAEKIRRALRGPISDTTAIADLPTATVRASKYLAFDADGNPVASAGTGSDPALRADLASAAPGAGASLVGFQGGKTLQDLRSAANGKGASLISVEDAANRIVAAQLEAALAEINSWTVIPRNANTVLTPQENRKVIKVGATYTQTFNPVATLGQGWSTVFNVDTGFVLTLSGTFNGIVNPKVAGNGKVMINCDGAAFYLTWLDDATDRQDVASAASIDLRREVVGGKYSRITGSNAISTIVLRSGENVDMLFAAALTFTNGASLVLPGTANILTVAGDAAEVIGEPTSVVRCLDYRRGTGAPLKGDFPALIATQTANNSSQIDVNLSVFSQYTKFLIFLRNVLPVNNNVNLGVQFSTNGGSSFITAGYFRYMQSIIIDGGATLNQQNNPNVSSILLGGGASNQNNGSTKFLKGVLELIGFNQSDLPVAFFKGLYGTDGSSGPTDTNLKGGLLTTATHNAIRFAYSSGNIASGVFEVYGIP